MNFLYTDPADEYLNTIKTAFNLENMMIGLNSEFDKVKTLCFYISGLWAHNGYRKSKSKDPVFILNEVKKGKSFRCVEYSLVLAGCLTALGITSRPLTLMTASVDTAKANAAHVVAESYLAGANKWIYIDPQWGVIPVYKHIPLNVFELKYALDHYREKIEFVSAKKIEKEAYLDWIEKYLFYFMVYLDNRINNRDNGKQSRVLFFPEGENKPVYFQANEKLENIIYTDSQEDFY